MKYDANETNMKILKEVFDRLRDLDCDRADCKPCFFYSETVESHCHLSEPIRKWMIAR